MMSTFLLPGDAHNLPIDALKWLIISPIYRFNQGGQDENAIITSTGQFVIAWDFAKVKKGLLDKYEIKK